jgi:VCBS repeat-containing protein
MATYTHNEIAVPGGAQWYNVDIDGNNPVNATSTLLVLPNSDGTQTHIIGTDFTYDGDGNPTGGSVTQIDRISSDGTTVYETVTGLEPVTFVIGNFIVGNVQIPVIYDEWTYSFDLVPIVTSTLDDGNRSFFTLIFGLSDTFNGFSGDDLFVGGGFGDRFDGGSGGTDTVSYDNALEGVRVNLSHPPVNTGDAAGDTYTSIENLIGSDFNDSLVGNSSDNVLSGGLGDDSFGGAGGVDTMIGGAGNDGYLIDSNSDLVIENPGEGFDTVNTWVGGTLGPNIEVLALQGDLWLIGTGNELDNDLYGNSAPNALYGMEGDDFLWGSGAYSDEFGDLGDTLVGGAGNDTFFFAAYDANGDEVLDFTGNGTLAGDSFRFFGFGTAAQGATFTRIGTTNQWQIHSGLDRHNEYITLVNGASVDASDYVFEGAPGNTAPVAWGDNYQINEDQALNLAAAGVLLNDTDADNDPLTAVLVSDAQHGTVALNGNGSFSYTPDANYNGPDSFIYKANDGQADSNIAFVSLIVNPVDDTPVASNDSYATNEDTLLTVNAAPGVLLNDTDADSNPLTAVLVSRVQHGTLTLNPDGSFTYTPDANYNGLDSFTYQANDGQADSNVATVSLTVTPVNDAPVANDDSYSMNEDTVLTVNAAAGVLTNDSDADGDPLHAALVSGPAHGTVTSLTPDGSFVYMPLANYNGADSFTYKAFDGGANSDVATVSIMVDAVNDAPVALADAYSTAFRTTLTIDAATGVLQNDRDVDGDPITAELVTPTRHGTLTLNPDGSFSYVPKANYPGQDSFVYHATDGAADSNDVTVQIGIAARNARDFSADSGSDILLQHDSGLPAIWTMDGTTPTGSDWLLV